VPTQPDTLDSTPTTRTLADTGSEAQRFAEVGLGLLAAGAAGAALGRQKADAIDEDLVDGERPWTSG
jgi:hypothetical protein